MAWIIIESAPLNDEQMANNAQEYANGMAQYNMTANSISAQLGNIQSESAINPGRWQSDIVGDYSAGFGLVQWTPATNYIDWAQEHGYQRTDPAGQLEWIATVTASAGQWIPTGAYPLSWEEFLVSNESPEYLARAFLYNFERPADPAATEAQRAAQARHWFDTLDFSGGGG